MTVQKFIEPTYEECMSILNYLDRCGYDTRWIRYLWKLQGMTNQWCMDRCEEIINIYQFDTPDILQYDDPYYTY